MEKTKEFTLDRSQEPHRQLFVFTDTLTERQRLCIAYLAKRRAIDIRVSKASFSGAGERNYSPPFTTRMMVEIPPKKSIDDILTDKLEASVNAVLEAIQGRCAVYSVSSELYYRESGTEGAYQAARQ